MTNLQAALSYAARGWHVFPCWWIKADGACACSKGPHCERAGKHPIAEHVPHGLLNATTEPGLLSAWWTVHPSANIAVATGVKSNLYVVDCDMPNGFKAWVGLEQGGVDEAPIARTGGGGRHIFLTCPGPDFRNTGKATSNAIGEDIDSRGEGGYALLPPSNHKSGGFYTWLTQGQPSPMPEWLQAQLRTRAAKPKYQGPIELVPDHLRRVITAQEIAGVVFALSTQGGTSPAVAEDLRKVLAGKPWGAPGGRDAALLALSRPLAKHFQDMDTPGTAQAIFEASRAAVEAEDYPATGRRTEISYVANMLERAIVWAAGEIAREKQEAEFYKAAGYSNAPVNAETLTQLAKKAPKGEAEALRLIRDGQAATPQQVKLAGQYIAKKLPQANAAEVGALVSPSLALGSASVEEFTAFLAAEQAAVVKQTEEAQSKTVSEREGRIQRAFLSQRVEPYTLSEIESMAPHEKMWIISAGGSAYVRGPYDYVGPMAREDLPTAARDLLAPAYEHLKVDVYYMTDKGASALKSAPELLDEYGTVAHGVEFSYSASASRYDSGTGVFVRAGGRRVLVAPHFDPQIDQWIKLFAGDKYGHVLDWLSLFMDTSKPLRGLLMQGESGAGKNLMAYGLARAFEGRTPVGFTEAWSTFNSALRKQPVVYADESVAAPKDSKESPLDLIKRTVTDESRSTQSKGKDAIVLHGCLRLLLGTNDANMLRTGKSRLLQKNDLDALGRRLIMVRPSAETVEYLNSLGDTPRTWVTEDKLAAHVLWLDINHERVPGRLEADTQDFSSLAASSDGTRELLEALVTGLVMHSYQDAAMVQAREGRVWFNPQRVREKWSSGLSRTEMPEDFKSAYETITEKVGGETSRIFRLKNEVVRQRAVHVAMVRSAAARMGLEEELEIVLAAGWQEA